MVSKALVGIVAHVLLESFAAGRAITRRDVVHKVAKIKPELNHPRIELEIAHCLNILEGKGTLQRIEGKFYAPGERLCKVRRSAVAGEKHEG